MSITLKDVAALAGVSRSAVSRTFTDGASVSAKTRQKVERAAARLGYRPNALASSLTTGRTRLIGLIANNFHNPIFLEVFDLFTRGLQDRGLRPLLVNLSDETDPEASLSMLRQYSVDGVIVATSTLPPAFPRAFREAGVPVVHSFGRFSSAPDLHVVGIDNAACGRMAAETLIARGYRRLAFLGGPEGATSTQDRQAGFAGEIARHPGVTLAIRHACGYTFEAGRATMARHLAETPPETRPEAYFCGDDILSIGALSAVRDAGLHVPDDIGLLGLNDMEMAAWAGIALTTIHQPVRQIIGTSIEVVVALTEEPNRLPEARLFPCRLVERQTLRPLP